MIFVQLCIGMRKNGFIILKSSFFISLMGVVAYISGNAFIFPSLGPTAYILAFDQKISHSANVVIGGHSCGVLGGLAGYHLMASPTNLMMLTDPMSGAGFHLAAASVVAIAVTVFLMLSLNISHPPACATTLIIALGILPHWVDVLVIMAAVVILYYSYWAVQKVTAK